LKASEVQFGRERIQKVARAWGITVRQAARVLEGGEFRSFWQWVRADEFLCMKLYEDPCADLRVCDKCYGSGRLYPGGYEDSEGIQCWRCGGKGELPNDELRLRTERSEGRKPRGEYEMSSEETKAERVPCTLESVVLRLKSLDRIRHRVCDDGDGYIDDWPSDDPEGPYVEWERIKEVIEWIEQNDSLHRPEMAGDSVEDSE